MEHYPNDIINIVNDYRFGNRIYWKNKFNSIDELKKGSYHIYNWGF